MANFSHLKVLEVTKEASSEFTIHSITVNGRTPTLYGRPAAQVNEQYFNALLKSGVKNAKALQAGKINVGIIEENRKQDRELFPKCVITGWVDMLDADGVELEFSVEVCDQFLRSLPNHIFDDIKNHFANEENFIDAIDIKVDVKAKNSPAA